MCQEGNWTKVHGKVRIQKNRRRESGNSERGGGDNEGLSGLARAEPKESTKDCRLPSHFQVCHPGTFSFLYTQNNSEYGGCRLCPVGTFSSLFQSAESAYTCRSCVMGSTTLNAGASDVDLCIRPENSHALQCTSGAVCNLTITGYSLQLGCTPGATVCLWTSSSRLIPRHL